MGRRTRKVLYRLKIFMRKCLKSRSSSRWHNRIWNKMLNRRFYPKAKMTSSLATMKKKSQNMTRSMKVRRLKMKGP